MMTIERPQGYEHEKNDCTVHALSLALNIPYEAAHSALKKYGRRDKHGIGLRTRFSHICKDLGVDASHIRRSGTVAKLCKDYPQGRIFAIKRGHAFAIIDGVAHDLTKLGSHVKSAWLLEVKQ